MTYAIDLIQQKGTGTVLVITGWAYDPKTKDGVLPEVRSGGKLVKTQGVSRPDVSALKSVKPSVGFVVFIQIQKGAKTLELAFQDERVSIDLQKTYPKYVDPNGTLSTFKKGLAYVKQHGFKATLSRMKHRTRPEDQQQSQLAYQAFLAKKQEITRAPDPNTFTFTPLISILVPVYNVDEVWLKACVDSVLAQTYPNWELCLVDDASTAPHVAPLLLSLAEKDDRIKVKLRETNGHICVATNDALDMARGEWIALLDNDDVLVPGALAWVVSVLQEDPQAQLIYSDEDKLLLDGTLTEPAFKPDFSPELLLSTNYISHLGVYETARAQNIGGFRAGFEGAQDYDFVLRFTEQCDPKHIHHIPEVLYHWRVIPSSTAANPEAKLYAFEAGRKAVEEALIRRNRPAIVTHAAGWGLYDVQYALKEEPLISILMPTRDGVDDVLRALTSIREKTTYPHYEVLLLDNNSSPEAKEVFFKLERTWDKLRVIDASMPFNYSAINNLGAKAAKGSYLVLLNNDTEVISPDWLTDLLRYAQWPEIGAVGAKLLYPNHTIQHAGVVLGLGGVAGHGHHTFPESSFGYFGRLQVTSNVSAVTAACLMVSKADFEAVGGLTEDLAVAYNDVDFCLKLLECGKRNVFVSKVTLYHFESQTRGHDITPEKKERLFQESQWMKQHWNDWTESDPYYSPNLTRKEGTFRVKYPDEI